MNDPFGAMLANVTNDAWGGVPLAAFAGLATSVGPCAAPRYLAIAAFAGERRAVPAVAAFVAGIAVAYVAIGAASDVLGTLVAHTTVIDLVLAIGLIAFGVATLVREPHACAHDGAKIAAPRVGGAFALGAGSALVVSPCCTPVLVAIAGLGVVQRDPAVAAATLAAFALGHAAPIAILACLGGASARGMRGIAASAAPAVVSGTLAIALGVYYGLLA